MNRDCDRDWKPAGGGPGGAGRLGQSASRPGCRSPAMPRQLNRQLPARTANPGQQQHTTRQCSCGRQPPTSPTAIGDDLARSGVPGRLAASHWTCASSPLGAAPVPCRCSRSRRADIEGFARDLEARGRARATVTRRPSTIAGFYKYAVEEELLEHSPAARVRRPRVDYEISCRRPGPQRARRAAGGRRARHSRRACADLPAR
jgi:hypothetical protein